MLRQKHKLIHNLNNNFHHAHCKGRFFSKEFDVYETGSIPCETFFNRGTPFFVCDGNILKVLGDNLDISHVFFNSLKGHIMIFDPI